MIFILAHFLLKLGSVHTLCKSGNLKEVVFMNNSAALSQFAVNLKYEDIPAEVWDGQKNGYSDHRRRFSQQRNGFYPKRPGLFQKVQRGPADATLMLDGRKTSLLGAVFANSIISDNIDWEDAVGPVILLPALFLRRWHWPRREGNRQRLFDCDRCRLWSLPADRHGNPTS